MKSKILNFAVGAIVSFIALTLNQCEDAKPFVEQFCESSCEEVMFINDFTSLDTVYLEKIKFETKYITKVKTDTFYVHDTITNGLVPIYANVFTTHHEARDNNLKLLTWDELIVSNDSIIQNTQVAEYEIKYNQIVKTISPKKWTYSVGMLMPITNVDSYIPMPAANIGYKNHSVGFAYDIDNSSFYGSYFYTFGGTNENIEKLKTTINGSFK